MKPDLLKAKHKRITSLFVAIPLLALSSISCAPRSPITKAYNPIPNSLVAIQQVQMTPQYNDAETFCSKGKYADAASQLAKLENARNLSQYQLAYIRQQRAICIDHLLHPGPIASPPALRVPPPKPDCGPRALALVLHHIGMPVKLSDIDHTTHLTPKGCSMQELSKDAKRYGLHPVGVQVARNGISKLITPAIGWVDNNHYIAVYSLQDGKAVVHDPNVVSAATISQQELLRLTGGYFLELGN